MIILAIDPGTKCGWAVRHEDGTMEGGMWDFTNKRFEDRSMSFIRFRAKLTELIKATNPTLVAYEEVRRHAATIAAQVYGGYVATLQMVCKDHGIPYGTVTVQQVKKSATGRGNADKRAVFEAATIKWPLVEIRDDNQADAMWIAEAMIEQLDEKEDSQ